MSENRYTVDGKTIDAVIDRHLEIINRGVLSVIDASELEAVILCGGYGRGEGGVFVGADGSESLYNDYDMFVIIKPVSGGRRVLYQSRLKTLGHQLGGDFGIDVDFGPLKTLAQMKKSPFTLFNYELKYGHKVTFGNPDVLSVMPSWNGDDIAVMEAVKLLLNRGVGLFLSQEKLKGGMNEADNEFVTRNIYKAIMAIGDAVLMCCRRYNYSYLKRMELMKERQDSPLVKELDIYDDYMRSIEYKLRPKKNIFNTEELAEMLEKNTGKLMKMFYAAAGKAYKRDDGDYRIFSRGFIDQCDPIQTAANMLLNLKSFRLCGFDPVWFMKYPRVRLFYCLGYMLGCQVRPTEAQVRRALGIGCGDEIRARFISLWERYG